jgi:hypothetical protein
MMNEEVGQTGFLISESSLTPTKRRLLAAFLISLVVHAAGYTALQYAPVVGLALNFRQLEFVDEDYDRAILIDLSKPLRYPGNYPGFGVPEEVKDLEEVKKAEEARRRRLEAERRRREAEREREEREAAEREAPEKSVTAEQQAQAAPTPAPKPTPAPFGRINTAPIRDQIQRLYEAKKAGHLVLPEGKLRVGVAGQIKADGSIENYRVIVSSGREEIDRAALAILEAVSASKALGPLHQLTSLSMILDVDQTAKLTVTGFAPDEQTAAALQALAKFALDLARRSKAGDPAAMVILNNIRVSQSSKRIQADVVVPRQTASDTLAKTMGGAGPQ